MYELLKSTFRSVDVIKAFGTIISTLWYLKLPCFDIKGLTGDQNGQKSMLKQCVWKGITIPCSAIFTRVTTDQVKLQTEISIN